MKENEIRKALEYIESVAQKDQSNHIIKNMRSIAILSKWVEYIIEDLGDEGLIKLLEKHPIL